MVENGRTGTRRILWAAIIGAVALIAGAAIAVSTTPFMGDTGPTPPPFSHRITSAYPGAPFVTCDVGQFEDPMPGRPGPPQRWYMRPTLAGDLRIDVQALPGGPNEQGALAALLYDARGAVLAEALVPYPTGGATPPPPNVVSMRATVVASAIYRLEVRRAAPQPGVAEARHYRLGFSGTPIEVGVHSPALPRWLEGLNFGRQLFHVNVDPGERLRLTITAGEGQPIPSMTTEVRDEQGALLKSTTSVTWDPFDVVVEPAGPRTLRIVAFGNHHFTLDKRSGSDRGIYFDTCPPNAPPR